MVRKVKTLLLRRRPAPVKTSIRRTGFHGVVSEAQLVRSRPMLLRRQKVFPSRGCLRVGDNALSRSFTSALADCSMDFAVGQVPHAEVMGFAAHDGWSYGQLKE